MHRKPTMPSVGVVSSATPVPTETLHPGPCRFRFGMAWQGEEKVALRLQLKTALRPAFVESHNTVSWS